MLALRGRTAYCAVARHTAARRARQQHVVTRYPRRGMAEGNRQLLLGMQGVVEGFTHDCWATSSGSTTPRSSPSTMNNTSGTNSSTCRPPRRGMNQHNACHHDGSNSVTPSIATHLGDTCAHVCARVRGACHHDGSNSVTPSIAAHLGDRVRTCARVSEHGKILHSVISRYVYFRCSYAPAWTKGASTSTWHAPIAALGAASTMLFQEKTKTGERPVTLRHLHLHADLHVHVGPS